MSMFTPIDGITDALNDRTNQIGDNINLILNKMWKVNRYADMIKPIETAMEVAVKREKPVKEDWYVLLKAGCTCPFFPLHLSQPYYRPVTAGLARLLLGNRADQCFVIRERRLVAGTNILQDGAVL